MSDELLSACVIAYFGSPGQSPGRSPEDRVVDTVGQIGLDVLPAVKALLDEVYDADPPLFNYRTVSEMGRAVMEFLRERHPQLSPEAANAVANQFTFDYK